MDWEDLRYLLALARTGSLSGAAGELGVVRTTVGRRVDALESSLGVRLFDRTPEGFVPTGSGHDLAEVATRIEAEVLAAQGRVLGRDAELRGTLRVTTLDFIYDAYVDVFSAFIARYPGVELTIGASYDEVSLRRREADVAIRLTNTPSPHLVGRRLGRIHIAVYGSRDLLSRFGPEPDLNELPWLRQDERLDDGSMDGWFAQHAPNARVAMRIGGSYPVLRAAVSAGVGVHFLPRIDADRDPNLVALTPNLPEALRELWALTLPDLRTNTRVRAFTDHIYESLRQPDPAAA